ncbi:uncharacterized protein CTRU02_203669 [Colletotrichum truncatum]|uniref:Uncharacterized protein n=1 Tax=Colletotrichum truncatum TaxID=5467 RepID=A0ACC3Z9Y4_COLTU|nr:uncharacterized protein CTRU02_04001 [Colletotrichum truncatum]KAF6796041.1 hypothetical protein CTRU02_04001 [Colletotrichum truncatum]
MSQLVRFRRESPRDGNALVTLANSSQDRESATRYHQARAAQNIKAFEQKFGK